MANSGAGPAGGQGASGPLDRVGIVAIGRNEGERLRRCLVSAAKTGAQLVYVDSGSTDGSAELARSMGAEVVELDMSKPFTAGRARNEGVARLLEAMPTAEYVHFIDGDCEFADGWFAAALAAMRGQDRLAGVWGVLVERRPDATTYNRLCDTEWRWCFPFGESLYCGGIALMRVAAYRDVGGFNGGLIAGEEPEMCFRMRRTGWRFWRLDRGMAYHDADMHRFGQWWRRVIRTGYADAERAWLYRGTGGQYWAWRVASAWVWSAGVVVVGVGAAPWTWGLSLLLLLVYAAQAVRVARGLAAKGAPWSRALEYGVFCILAKFATILGHIRFLRLRLMGRRSEIIEYK